MNGCQCLNNGQCVQVMVNETVKYHCVCSDCTQGERCENIHYYVQYTMTSLMSIDILLKQVITTRMALKIIYVVLFVLLTIISFINSCLSIITCVAYKVRITVCGLFMILYAIFSFLTIVTLQIIVIVVLFYNDELRRQPMVHCQLIPMILDLTFYASLWLSAFIAVERALIEFFNYSLYRTRTYSASFAVIFLVLLIPMGIATAQGRTVDKNPVLSTSNVCSFNNYTNANVKLAHEVIGGFYLHVVVPWILHLLSISLTLAHIIRKKIALNDLERNSWPSLIMQQISKHKDFFIPPIMIIVCTLPQRLLINIAGTYCIEKSKQKLYICFHIALDFLYYMPLVLPFFIYIYPSKVYMNVFRETRIVKWFKQKVLSYSYRCKDSDVVASGEEQIIDEQIEETHF